ncbi:hypothetical protein YC2023_041081 [Brassica napus]
MLPIISIYMVHCSPKSFQIHGFHMSHHPHKRLINLGNLLWEDRWWWWWKLKNPWNLLNRGLLLPLNLNWWNRLNRGLLMPLNLNWRNLLSCSHLPNHFLCSYSSSLLDSLLECLLCGLSGSILHHPPKGILINRWNWWRHMLISTLSRSTSGLRANNFPTRRHLKERGTQLTYAKTEHQRIKT